MDPFAVLGLEPSAAPDDVRRAHRRLAKRLHPDRAGEPSGALMAAVNAAVDQIRGLAPQGIADDAPPSPMRAGRRPGDWLAPAVRAVLAPPLLAALHDREPVRDVALAGVPGGGDAQLVVTDRRLLWLASDTVRGSVRAVRLADVRALRVRSAGPLHPRTTLQIRARGGLRVRFVGVPESVCGRLARRMDSHAVRTLL